MPSGRQERGLQAAETCVQQRSGEVPDSLSFDPPNGGWWEAFGLFGAHLAGRTFLRPAGRPPAVGQASSLTVRAASCRPFRARDVRRGGTGNTGQGCPVNRQAGMPAPRARRGSTEAGTSRPRPLPCPIFLPPFFCRKKFRCADWVGGPRRRPVPAPAAHGPSDSGFVPQPPSPGPCAASARLSPHSWLRSAEGFRPPASPAGLMELGRGRGRKPKLLSPKSGA